MFFPLFHIIGVVALIASVIGVYYWLRSNILAKNKSEAQEEYIKVITKSYEDGKENEEDISKLSDDELVDRLSK